MPSSKPFDRLRDEVTARPGAAERLAVLREQTLADLEANDEHRTSGHARGRPLGAYDGPYRLEAAFFEADVDVQRLFDLRRLDEEG